MSQFTEISVLTDGEAAEAVAEALRPYAYQDSVVLEQLGDANDPDPLAVEPAVTVKIYLPQEEDTAALRRRIEEILYHLNRLYPVAQPLFRVLKETDWANAWKEHYRPFRVGERIWIQPSWIADGDNGGGTDSAAEDDIVLTLDPGMAFGTGLHPTTQKCLRALEKTIRPGDRVLDVGTGSGILAIAAVKLGAASVTGIDTDAVAVKTAVANAKQNGVLSQTIFGCDRLPSVTERQWNVVLVNILAPVIINLLAEDDLLGYLAADGRLILSGIIDEQVPGVESALASAGGYVRERLIVRDWVTLIAAAIT